MVIFTKATGMPVLDEDGIFSERLKNDADMDILGCAVVERIEKRNEALVTPRGDGLASWTARISMISFLRRRRTCWQI